MEYEENDMELEDVEELELGELEDELDEGD
jgi:hypothetical protein